MNALFGHMKKILGFGKTLLDMKKIIQITAAEGGQDAKLLVGQMRDIYIKTANQHNIH